MGSTCSSHNSVFPPDLAPHGGIRRSDSVQRGRRRRGGTTTAATAAGTTAELTTTTDAAVTAGRTIDAPAPPERGRSDAGAPRPRRRRMWSLLSRSRSADSGSSGSPHAGPRVADDGGRTDRSGGGSRRRRRREGPRRWHSIEDEVSNDAIPQLYSAHDNYVVDAPEDVSACVPPAPVPAPPPVVTATSGGEDDGSSSHYRRAADPGSASVPTVSSAVTSATRSPRSLYELALAGVCRSLPNMIGPLPRGLPREVSCAIVQSLQKHGALNSTTLPKLRHCEDITALSLSNARGVTDGWVAALMASDQGDSDVETDIDADADNSVTHPHPPDAAHPPTKGADTGPSRDAPPACSSGSGKTRSGHRKGCASTHPPPPPAFSDDDEAVLHLPPQQDVSALSHHDLPPSPRPRAPSDGGSTSLLASVLRRADQRRPRPPAPHALVANLRTLDLRSSARLTDRGLLRLPPLPRLAVAQLDGCHVSGRGLLFLRHSAGLRTLSLTHCRQLTDEGLLHVGGCGGLVNLSLGGCRRVTDEGVAALAGLVHLERLDLSQCDAVTDAGLHALRPLVRLRELSLGWCRSLTDAGVDELCAQEGRAEHLRVLTLARCQVTDVGAAHIARLTALEELDLNGCARVGSAALGRALGAIPGLTSLDVSYCPGIIHTSWQDKIASLRTLDLKYSSVHDQHLAHFSSLPNLQDLNLDSCPVSDWSIAHLSGGVAPRLRSLDLADTDVSDAGLVYLSKFKELAHLSLFYCNISNAGLRHLATMASLETLNLDSRDIGDDGLLHLRGLSHLRSLDIFSGRVTDHGCRHLAALPALESLELCGGGVGDRGCAHLAQMELLTSLNLSQNERITNRGAAALAAGLPRLVALNLSHTSVDASAVRDLGGMVGLKSLALYGCKGVDGRSAEALRDGLPRLKCLRMHEEKTREDGDAGGTSQGWLRRLRRGTAADTADPERARAGQILGMDGSDGSSSGDEDDESESEEEENEDGIGSEEEFGDIAEDDLLSEGEAAENDHAEDNVVSEGGADEDDENNYDSVSEESV